MPQAENIIWIVDLDGWADELTQQGAVMCPQVKTTDFDSKILNSLLFVKILATDKEESWMTWIFSTEVFKYNLKWSW